MRISAAHATAMALVLITAAHVNAQPAGWEAASAPCHAYPWAKGTAVTQAKSLNKR